MIETPELTQEYVRKRFSYVDGKLIWRGRLWGKEAGCVRFDGRVIITLNKKQYLRYRLIWLYHHGTLPAELDHIDRNCANDRIENLREADRFINNANTNATGVTKVGNRFVARIFQQGKQISLGSYDTWVEAHMAYRDAREANGSPL